jgi:two-component system, NarL family, sensor histidine kinase DevS
MIQREEVKSATEQLAALDEAVRGIAGELSVDRVLQLIVDRVRELVGAQYAALGIVKPDDDIEQFITSGLSAQDRARIGALPRGRGLLGLIIREDQSFLVDDISHDSRSSGFPPNHPEMHSFLGVPVRSKGRSIGNLYLTNKITATAFSEADLRLVEMFALHAGIAMENARLHEEVQRLVLVDERQRIAQDLHDSIIQSLYGISLSLEDLPELVVEDSAEGRRRTDRAIDSIHATIRDIRNFIMGLESEALTGDDLAASIETLVRDFRASAQAELDVSMETLPTVPSARAAHVLAITREGLSNIARHSGATKGWLAVSGNNGVIRLIIRDNGHGFDLSTMQTADQHGLANLRSRAESAGGSLEITSAVGAGTTLIAMIDVIDEAGSLENST